MLTQTKKTDGRKAARGFTIIEVMIVLAIAGLILLIVFLAVPALQRSARNTQRKNDAAGIAAAIASFISNNGGTLPKSLGKDADPTSLDLCSAGGAATGGGTACTAGTNLETAKMGYFTPANVSLATAAVLTTPAVTSNTVVIELGENCNASNTGAGQLNTRTAAVFYATETSAASSTQCVEQ